MNRHMVIGHLGQDPKVTEKAVMFSVATTENFKDAAGEWQNKTAWHNVVCFGYLIKVASSLIKGDKVMVEGPNETREWTDKKGDKQKSHQITARAIEVYGKRPDREKAEPTAQAGDADDYSFDEHDPF